MYKIIKHICQAKTAFNNKKILLASKNITLKIRKKSTEDIYTEYNSIWV